MNRAIIISGFAIVVSLQVGTIIYFANSQKHIEDRLTSVDYQAGQAWHTSTDIWNVVSTAR